MDWSVGMRSLRAAQQRKSEGIATEAVFEVQGLMGWILSQLRCLRSRRETHRRHLRLVETLPLGGKRQLMLVTCRGESFLVGGGMESVETIVRLKAEVPLDAVTTGLDEPCQ